MFDGDILSVLPRHSTEFERALEQASLWVIRNSEIVDVWNPDKCPKQFLPWLAWSVSVDEWDAAWSVERKRDIIRSSVAIHRLKGTKGAVRRALEAMGFGPEIVEWFENGGAVHTFDVEAYANDVFEAGFTIGPELYNLVLRQIDHVKPARAHFTLKIGEQFRVSMYVRNGIRSQYRDERRHDPRPRVHETEVSFAVRSAHRLRAVSYERHDCHRRAG